VPSDTKDDMGIRGGTIQARITCKDPPAQTFPPIVKKCYRSHWDDGCIASLDLSQIELRVAALLSGDPSLVRNYVEKKDLHTDRAVQIWGMPVLSTPGFGSGDSTVDKRQWGKQLNFADLFLASPFRMQKTILELSGQLLPLPFFEGIARSRYEIRPGLCKWQYEMARHAEREGVIALPFTGQSRCFLGFQLDHEKWEKHHVLAPRAERFRDGDSAESLLNEIVNFPIQTTAGNVLLRFDAVLRRLLPSPDDPSCPVYQFLNVYDALYFNVRRSYVPTLRAKFAEASAIVASQDYWAMLCEHYRRTVPFSFSVSVKKVRPPAGQ
jgi:hypothetical protein